ncbi:MAG TPA: AAA family ATPase [Methylocella sp.]|nr:AAA family ATPase [Methylocella sp.]
MDSRVKSIVQDFDRTRAAAKTFDIVTFIEIGFATIIGHLVKGILPRRGLAIIWGPPKCGKSFWLFDILMHVAMGWEYRDRKVVQGAVVYCALEGADGFRKRVEAFRQKHFLADYAGEIPFYLMTTQLSLFADHEALIAAIRQKLGDVKPVAVAIDTLNRSIAGSESSDEDMGNFIKGAAAIEAAFECLVPVIHHCGHEGTRPRGFSGLLGANNAQIAVTKAESGIITCEVEMMKDGTEGEKVTSRLMVMELGLDDGNDMITSCVVVSADSTSQTISRRKKPTGAAKTALDALYDAIGKAGAIPPASNDIPRNTKCVKIEQWRTYSYMRGVSTSSEARARQQAFERASASLIGAGHASIWEKWVWPAL